MNKLFLFTSFIILLILGSSNSFAQTEKLTFYGNFRLAHIGSDTEPDGIGGPNTLLRLRPGVKYLFNENHSFSARLVYLVSKELEPINFTVKADGNGALAFGSMSFDEFYYQYNNSDFQLKLGRFQNNISVLSNARRSHLRFQSNASFVHWTDGIYAKKYLDAEWYAETVFEYQHQGDLSYPYTFPLTFGNNEHSVVSYLGIENRTRDSKNIIQKGFGLMFIPDAYLKVDGFSYYLVLDSRIAIDIPKKDLLNGGSFRIAGELGQNINTEIKNGTSAVLSFGINNFAEKHEFMVELAKTGSQWLTGTSYSANTDDIEFRYRYFILPHFNIDVRYRIRESRNDFIPTNYSTFFRATYSL